VLVGAAVGAALTIVATQPVLIGSDADAKTVTKTDVYRLLNMFGDAFEQVRSHYVERPNDAALVQTAVNGMLADLEDSYYIDPQALNRVDACTGPRCATAFGNVGVA
jgi:carboxyl-terminal processing protease